MRRRRAQRRREPRRHHGHGVCRGAARRGRHRGGGAAGAQAGGAAGAPRGRARVGPQPHARGRGLRGATAQPQVRGVGAAHPGGRRRPDARLPVAEHRRQLAQPGLHQLRRRPRRVGEGLGPAAPVLCPQSADHHAVGVQAGSGRSHGDADGAGPERLPPAAARQRHGPTPHRDARPGAVARARRLGGAHRRHRPRVDGGAGRRSAAAHPRRRGDARLDRAGHEPGHHGEGQPAEHPRVRHQARHRRPGAGRGGGHRPRRPQHLLARHDRRRRCGHRPRHGAARSGQLGPVCLHRDRREGRGFQLRRQRLERRHPAVGLRHLGRPGRTRSAAARQRLHRSRRLQAGRKSDLQDHPASQHAGRCAPAAGRHARARERARRPAPARRRAHGGAHGVEQRRVDLDAAVRRHARGILHPRHPRGRPAPPADARRAPGRPGAGGRLRARRTRRRRLVPGGGLSPSRLPRRCDALRRGPAGWRFADRRGHGALSFRRTDGREAGHVALHRGPGSRRAGRHHRQIRRRPLGLRGPDVARRRGSGPHRPAPRRRHAHRHRRPAAHPRHRAAGRHPQYLLARRRRRGRVAAAPRQPRQPHRASGAVVCRRAPPVLLPRAEDRAGHRDRGRWPRRHGRRRRAGGRHAHAGALHQRAARRRQRLLYLGHAAPRSGGRMRGASPPRPDPCPCTSRWPAAATSCSRRAGAPRTAASP